MRGLHVLAITILALAVVGVFGQTYKCPSKADGSEPARLLPHETDCTKYYTCMFVTKLPKPQSCAIAQKGTNIRLHFSYEKQACVWPGQGSCGRIGDDSTDSPVTSITPSTPDREDTGSAECPPKGSTERRTLHHECHCSRYYECEDGEKVLKTCGGTWSHFNRATKKCDLPENANCPNDRKCPLEETRLRHDNCNKYYQCKGGEKFEMNCRGDNHFSEERKVCAAPEVAKCLELPVCPARGWGVYSKIPHECFCSKYYKCEDGKQTVQDCKEDYHFDDIKGECVHKSTIFCTRPPFPDDSDGNDKPTEPPTKPPTQPPTQPPTEPPTKPPTKPPTEPPTERPLPENCPERSWVEVVHIKHEFDCTQYYICWKGTKVTGICPNGFYFSKERRCDTLENSVCDSNTIPFECPLERGTTYAPNENCCSRYYVCTDGKISHEECPKGMYFDKEMSACNWASFVDCKDTLNCDSLSRRGVSVY